VRIGVFVSLFVSNCQHYQRLREGGTALVCENGVSTVGTLQSSSYAV